MSKAIKTFICSSTIGLTSAVSAGVADCIFHNVAFCQVAFVIAMASIVVTFVSAVIEMSKDLI